MIPATAVRAAPESVSSTSHLQLVPQVFFHTLAGESVRCTGEVELKTSTVAVGVALQVSVEADLSRVTGLGMSRGRRYRFSRSRISFGALPPFPAVRSVTGHVLVKSTATGQAQVDLVVTLLVKPDGRVTASDVRISGVSRQRSTVPHA